MSTISFGHLIQCLAGDKDVFYAKFIHALSQGKAEVVCRKRRPVCVTTAGWLGGVSSKGSRNEVCVV